MSTKLLGVLGGDDVDDALLGRWVSSADAIFAADGAANRLARLGAGFHAVIGDMDSVEGWAISGSEVVHIPDQDTTDCDKLLNYAKMRGFRAITLAGIEGNLPDHVLAILHSCLRAPIETRLAYRTGLGYIVRPKQPLEIKCRPGTRVSLLPLVESKSACLRGVVWPLESATLSAYGQTSISNCAAEPVVSTSLEEGGALLYVGYGDDEMPFW